MRIKNILWIVALILIIIIVSTKQGKEDGSIPDGTYQNCYMISLKEDQMEVLIDEKIWNIACPVKDEEEKKDKIVDIKVENRQIKKIVWKEGYLEDKVEAVSQEEGWIVWKEKGKMDFSSNIKMYIKDEGGVRSMTKSGSLMNWDEVYFYVHDEKVEAIIANGQQNKQSIKVLLNAQKDGLYHDEVRLTASESYEVEGPEGTSKLGAGQEFHLTKENGSYRISSQEGKIRMLSFTHTSGYPEYRGEIIIKSNKEGYTIVNELPLEEYLYSVVSSEMPSSYPEEALKAQAVCARTYALYQMEQAYYSTYGAHVDDTVNSQVYNNVAETASSKNAVDATKGQYLEYEGEPIPAYFYSTSCGVTSDVNDVWLKDGESPVYLKGHFQGGDEETLDLSTEEAFAEFIAKEKDCYEKEEEWFRWSTTIGLKDLTKHINENVENGKIGTITDVAVADRSEGGVIKKVIITGEKGEITVSGEYQIRKVLCPENTKLTLKNQEEKTLDMLPSGYFAISKKKKKIVISGGGYGHGVGLSQNGAKAMAELSHGFEDILLFFYPDTTLLQKY